MTEQARCDIVCALEIACEQYEKDARLCRDAGDERTAQQFDEQAKRAELLIDSFQ